jgi:hypothetical protein
MRLVILLMAHANCFSISTLGLLAVIATGIAIHSIPSLRLEVRQDFFSGQHDSAQQLFAATGDLCDSFPASRVLAVSLSQATSPKRF